MADFVEDKAWEDQAEKSEQEEEEEEGEDGLPADEPEASGSDDSSEEDEDEELDEEDAKFLADGDEEDEDEGDEEAEERRKKKKRRHRELVLEEEDYELLEENTGVRQIRPQGHRRLKKARDIGGEAQHETAAALRAELFGRDDAGEGLEDEIEDRAAAVEPREAEYGGARGGGGRGPSARDGYEDDEFMESEEDDWLVNEYEDDLGGEGAPIRRQRRRKSTADALFGVDPSALAEANEIFGDVDELMEIYQQSRARAQGKEEAEEEEIDLEDVDVEGLSDDEAEEVLRSKREERRAEAAARRLQQQLEPGAMERHFMMPLDERIREIDAPEREQLWRGVDPENFDLDACAEWVLDELHEGTAYYKVRKLVEDGVREVEGPPPEWLGITSWVEYEDDGKEVNLLRGHITDTRNHRGLYLGRIKSAERHDWRKDPTAQGALKHAIRDAIKRIYEHHEEVPVLGMYRKELMGELLALHGKDEPANSEDERLSNGAKNPLYGVVHAHDRRARRWEVLWTVQRLAQRWRVLQRLKETRATSFQAALNSALTPEDQETVQACIDALATVQSMDELHDVDAKFKLVVPAPEDIVAALDIDGEEEGGYGNGGNGTGASQQQASQGGTLRRRRRANAREIAIRAGLRDASKTFSITAAQFAVNVKEGYAVHQPLDPSVAPSELAAQFVDPSHPVRRDPDMVLRSAIMILSAEIAAEPRVRKTVRDFVWEKARLNTNVTTSGASILTPFHPLGIAKRLRNKRLSSFESDTFLRVLEAESAGYITVDISLGEKESEALPQGIFLSQSIGPEAQAWNELRLKVLQEAVKSGILPGVVRDIRARLAGEARAAAARETSKALWELAIKPPLALIDADQGSEVTEKRIMGLCWGPGTPPTTLVILDAAGNMVDFMHCPQLSGPIPRPRIVPGRTYSIHEDPKKNKDSVAIQNFIESHQPHAIVIGVGHAESLALHDDIQNILDNILDKNARAFTSSETGGVVLIPSEDSVASLWEISEAAKEEMPSAAPVVRHAVALARQALDPLAVLCSLCGPTKEVLSLPLHPLQASLGEDERMRAVEETLTTAVAQVGVDINAAVANPWMAAPLPFVPGLGPRKAQALLRAISRAGGFIESRIQAMNEFKHVLGINVFRNVAPFLRVKASSKAAMNLELDPLDNTRIHPECYDLAVAVAQSAIHGVDEDAVVEHAMAAPGEVENLVLSSYDDHLQDQDKQAQEAEEQGQEVEWAPGTIALRGKTRISTLIDIQFEFMAPYGDFRAPKVVQSDKPLWEKNPSLFYWAAGESSSTLKPGRKVEARIRFGKEDLVRVVIPELNNIEGLIHPANVSSKAQGGKTLDCKDYFKQGDTVMAVITHIDPEKRVVELGTSSTLLNDELKWERRYLHEDLDKDYFLPTERELIQEKMEGRRRANKAVKGVRRAIRHPLFRNLQMADAAAALTAEDGGPEGGPVPVGTAIVRPGKSSRGLYLTMRLPADQVWHLAIQEKGKPTADLRLAPPLAVAPLPDKEEVYDDLDELAARFVDPLASALRALVMHRKWKGGGNGQRPTSWAAIQNMLRMERQQTPNAAAYCLAADERRPGAFYLGYCMGNTPHREFFVVLPDGFYYRKTIFSTVEKMIDAFKRNPVPQQVKDKQQQQERQEQRAPPQQTQQEYPPNYGTAQQQYQYQYGVGGQFGATVEEQPYQQQPQQQYPQQYNQQYNQQQYNQYGGYGR